MCVKLLRSSIFLTMLVANLNAIVFAATAIPEVSLHSQQKKSHKQDGAVQTTHLSREQIANSSVTNLSALLKRKQSIVRVTNNSGDGTQPALSIRGFGDNAAANSLILVDGFPLTNPSLLSPSFNSFSLLDIERVDITQGSEGTLWGDQAIGGVINIVTRHPEKLLTDTQIGLGSYHHQFYSAIFGNKAPNGVFVKVFGFSNKTDNYRGHNNETDNTLSGQVGWDYATGSIYINAQTFKNTGLSPGSLTLAQYNTNPRLATNDTFYAHYLTNRYWILSKQALRDDWMLETRFARNEIYGDGFLFADYNRQEIVNSIEPRLIGHWRQNKLLFGFYQQNNSYSIDSLNTATKTNADQTNLFGQIIIPVLEKLHLTLGARDAWQDNTISRIDRDNGSSINRVFVSEQGLAFTPTNAWEFFIRRDGNFRFPKANENAWSRTGINYLQPQTGVSYETGATWTTEKQKLQLNLYELLLHHEIAFDPSQTLADPFGSFSNFDSTVRDGVTVTESIQALSTLNVYGQFNYVRARFNAGAFSGNTIPAVPAVTANAGLNYEFVPGWHAQYDALYTGSAYASEDEANVGNRLNGYWISSVTLQREWKHISASFEVGNIFNQSYSIYTLYNPDTHMNTYNPGAGRNCLLTLKTFLD